MKKLLLIALLVIGSLFAQISPYISTGINISLYNEGEGIFDKKSGIKKCPTCFRHYCRSCHFEFYRAFL